MLLTLTSEKEKRQTTERISINGQSFWQSPLNAAMFEYAHSAGKGGGSGRLARTSV
jgi:hypothetical protein